MGYKQQAPAHDERVRIDKWLWAARFFKTRSLASEAVELGRAWINGERVKPARAVKVGDRVTIRRGEDEAEVLVLGLSEVRGPAPVAQLLYEETPESLARRADRREQAQWQGDGGYEGKGRPTKRDRRQMGRLTGG